MQPRLAALQFWHCISTDCCSRCVCTTDPDERITIAVSGITPDPTDGGPKPVGLCSMSSYFIRFVYIFISLPPSMEDTIPVVLMFYAAADKLLTFCAGR